MKRLLIAFALLFAPLVAHATCPSLPFTLTNGQVADANQVMANLNSIINCVNTQAANAPINTNITTFTGLTTPISILQGGTGASTASVALVNLGALASANNLSDLASAPSARTNLGLGTAATQNLSAFLQPSNNLSDVSSAATSRTNLGVGPAPTVGWFENQQPSGTGPGESLSASTWSRRTLSTTVSNNIAGAVLGSSQVSLPAGTYEVEAQAQIASTGFTGVMQHQLRLRNFTDSTTPVVGPISAVTSTASANLEVTATMVGTFTLSGTKTVEIDSFTNGTSPSGGFTMGSGEVEVYVSLYLRKIG